MHLISRAEKVSWPKPGQRGKRGWCRREQDGSRLRTVRLALADELASAKWKQIRCQVVHML